MGELLSDPAIRDLVNTPARACLIRKDHVYLPFLYLNPKAVKPGEAQMIRCNRRQLTLLQALKEGLSVQDAALKAELTEEQAVRFLKKKDVQAWLRNKAEEEAVLRDWTPEKWFALGQKWLDGDDSHRVPKHKIEVWRELGDRVVPKPSRNDEKDLKPVIEINIDPEAINRAFERQQSIEAQIVREQAA